MRTGTCLVGVLVVAATGAVLVRGQPDRPADAGKPARTITVSGIGTADGKPDNVRVYLGISSFAPTVAEARAMNVAATRKVQAAIAGLNLPGLHTRTVDTTVAARYEKTEKGEAGKMLGYDVTLSFTVRVKNDDPDKLAVAAEQMLDAGLTNGANYQGRVEFFLADDTALKRQAQQRAVEDALAAAKAYAAGAKLTVVGVDSIEEPQAWSGGVGLQQSWINNVRAGGGEGGTLAAGSWVVTSSVRVVCRY